MRTNPTPDVTRRAASTEVEVARLVDVIAALREHCPWTATLTHDSLTTYLLEESYELIEAIESGHGGDIANELGDILLQVVLHARLAQESGSFGLADVVRGLSEKMIRRSPHVFHPDGTLQDSFPATIDEIEAVWERVKGQERDAAGAAVPGAAAAGAASPFAGIPSTLPALAMAQKSVERAARAGVVMPALAGNVAGPIETEEQLGRMLFEAVHGAQERGLDAERALRQTVRDFQGR